MKNKLPKQELHKTDTIPSLPLEVVNLLKQVRFTFSNYKEGTIGKDMSNEADRLLSRFNGN